MQITNNIQFLLLFLILRKKKMKINAFLVTIKYYDVNS